MYWSDFVRITLRGSCSFCNREKEDITHVSPAKRPLNRKKVEGSTYRIS